MGKRAVVQGEGVSALEAARADMEAILKKANVKTLDYSAFEKNAQAFIDKAGNHSTKPWVTDLARGLPGALNAELPAVGLDALRKVSQESGGNMLADLSARGTASATKMFAGVGQEISAGLGVPPEIIMPVVQAAQSAVMSGLGSVASGVLVQAGLGALTGGVSVVAGGLLSMALGSFFGEGKAAPPAPPPAPRDRTIKKPTSKPSMSDVWSEVFAAAVRWRRDGLGTNAYGTNHLYLASGYTADTRRAPGRGWKFEPDDVSAKRTPYIPTTTEWQWLGPPIPWGIGVGGGALESYRFTHDALARWVGYNQNLSYVTQREVEKGFSDKAIQDGKFPHLRPFVPFFGTIGWAEWIVSGMAAEYLKDVLNPTLATLNRAAGVTFANPYKWAGPHLHGFDKYGQDRLSKSSYGAKSLKTLIDNRMVDPLGALAFVTQVTQRSMAAGFALAAQEKESVRQTNVLKGTAQDWRDQTLASIAATTGGAGGEQARREQDKSRREREEDAKLWKAGIPLWALVAAAGLVGLGVVFARRR